MTINTVMHASMASSRRPEAGQVESVSSMSAISAHSWISHRALMRLGRFVAWQMNSSIGDFAITGSDIEIGSFTALQTLYTKTASGATTLAAGTELARYVVKPSDPLYVKAVAVNNDATLTGKIEAYIRYIAR